MWQVLVVRLHYRHASIVIDGACLCVFVMAGKVCVHLLGDTVKYISVAAIVVTLVQTLFFTETGLVFTHTEAHTFPLHSEGVKDTVDTVGIEEG